MDVSIFEFKSESRISHEFRRHSINALTLPSGKDKQKSPLISGFYSPPRSRHTFVQAFERYHWEILPTKVPDEQKR